MKLSSVIQLIRPWQWLKNLMVYFPLLLSGAIVHYHFSLRIFLPFAAFCLVSSAAYIFNDLIDLPRDARHPEKRSRPLPSGAISKPTSMLVAAVLVTVGLIIGGLISTVFVCLMLVYLLVSISYTLLLKNLPIIDVFCISLGFVLRLYGGGEAFDVLISEWLFLSVFFLSVFLSVGKRCSERLVLGDAAGEHRPTLEEYPDGFFEVALCISGAAVLVTYAIYAISKPFLVYSVPLCMFGLLRYLMRIKSGQSGDPTTVLIKDGPLLVTSVLWLLIVGWSVYR